MKQYTFSNNWFDYNKELWSEHFNYLQSEENHILEIGSYEGAATTWLLDELANNEKSTVTTIDVFAGSQCSNCEDEINHKKATCANNLEERFMNNVILSKNYPKLEVIKMKSSDALADLHKNYQNYFNFIYIDGSHIACDVLADAVCSWPLLKERGFIVFDDYKWQKYRDSYDLPKTAIDGFISSYKPHLEILHMDYQIIIQKHQRKSKFKKS